MWLFSVSRSSRTIGRGVGRLQADTSKIFALESRVSFLVHLDMMIQVGLLVLFVIAHRGTLCIHVGSPDPDPESKFLVGLPLIRSLFAVPVEGMGVDTSLALPSSLQSAKAPAGAPAGAAADPSRAGKPEDGSDKFYWDLPQARFKKSGHRPSLIWRDSTCQYNMLRRKSDPGIKKQYKAKTM